MKRYILTGTPGAGKTAILRQLELDGFSVVEEAATDVIAASHAQGLVEVWRDPSFIDAIARLQRERQIRASHQPDEVQFHDRSVVCTAALAVHLGYPFSPFLMDELERVQKEAVYEARVFLIRNLGFVSRPRRGESAMRMRCVLSRSTNRRIARSALNCFRSSQQTWPNP